MSVEQLMGSGHPPRVALFPNAKGYSRISNVGQEPSWVSKGYIMGPHDAKNPRFWIFAKYIVKEKLKNLRVI